MAPCSAATRCAGTTSARSPSTHWARRAGSPGPSPSRPPQALHRPAAPQPGARQDGAVMAVDLRARLAHVELPNPVLTASGCAGAGRELAQFFDVAKIGAVVTKSVMLAPRSGRPTPRMAETPSGMLNSIGLQGPGIDAFLQRDLPWLLSR